MSSLETAGTQKGLDVMGTGDILHKGWYDEVTTYCKEDESTGTLTGRLGMKFILTVELECTFNVKSSTGDLTHKRIHNLICLRSLNDAQRLRSMLFKYGNLDTDGRPTISLTCEQLVNYLKDVIPSAVAIPCHVWTPHTSALGEEHGFNSLQEAYKSSLKHVFAVETGLSSDPAMCSEFPDTANLTQVSNSDAHSATTVRVGREATVLAIKDITYEQIFSAIKTRDNRFVGTVEVPTSFGKYHWSGHRYCEVSMDLKEYAQFNGYCPKCGKRATVGVLQRIHNISHGYSKPTVQKFWTLLPLGELLAVMYSKEVIYNYTQKLYKSFGSEYNILLNVSEYDLTMASNERIANVIMQNREGSIPVVAGYDGKYGLIVLQNNVEDFKQKTLAEIFSE